MKTLKKVLALTLAVLFCVGMVACNSKPASTPPAESSSSDSAETSTETSEKVEYEPGVNGEVVISHWGGSTSEAYRECYFNDFEKETGIKVVEVLATNNKSQLQAMVDTGSVDVDIMQGSLLEINYFTDREKETGTKYIADIDFSLLPEDEVAGLIRKFDNAVDAFGYASCLAYRTDVFSGDNVPNSWADFWDVEKFPGKRTMVSGVSGDYPPLEFALLADGKTIDNVYPMTDEDVDRAFEKLEEIKPHILKWWMSGSEAPQMLIDGEVVMAEGFSGRFMTVADQGAPIQVVYNEAAVNYDVFFIPEGSPNYENAHKLLSYMIEGERQAKFAKLTNYAPSNANALQYLDDEFIASLVTSQQNLPKTYEVDNRFWADNMLQIQDRWLAWEGN